MRLFEQYDEIILLKESRGVANDNEVQKELKRYDLSFGEYLTNKYALWLDSRMIDENALHVLVRG